MSEINILDIIVLLIPIIAILLGGLSGGYLALKKFLKDLVNAIEDDVITKEELILLIKDSVNIINVAKYLLKRK